MNERCKNCGTPLKDLVLFTSTTKYCPRCEEPTVPNHTAPKPANKSSAPYGSISNPYRLDDESDKTFDDLCKELEALLDPNTDPVQLHTKVMALANYCLAKIGNPIVRLEITWEAAKRFAPVPPLYSSDMLSTKGLPNAEERQQMEKSYRERASIEAALAAQGYTVPMPQMYPSRQDSVKLNVRNIPVATSRCQHNVDPCQLCFDFAKPEKCDDKDCDWCYGDYAF